MTVALSPAPDLPFDELVEALSGLARSRLTFALVRVELALRLGHEPALQDVWAEYTRRHPDTVRGVRAMVARGLVACPAEKPTAEADPQLDGLELSGSR